MTPDETREAATPLEYDGAYVDHANRDHVSGWALFSAGVDRIDILVDDRKVGEAEYGLSRVDVEALLPNVPGSRDAGFCYLFEPEDFKGAGPVAVVQVVFRSRDGKVIPSDRFQIPTAALPTRYAASAATSLPLSMPSPFPVDVQRALLGLRGDAVYGVESWTPNRIDEAVDDLIFLFHRASRETAGLFRYFAYLREMWLRIDFNARHFPRLNRTATAGQKDRYGVATGPEELFVICHHLATLKSRGIAGSLCEFGCFKGFSTSVLSLACSRLGMPMNVFDSFEGLPESDSRLYEAGEFAGSLHEVTRNVEEFGSLDAVRFRKGFFADSLKRYHEPDIACIWMDVDLECSARDVMTVLPRLAPESCVFSDELGPENFEDGRVVPEPPSPDSVLPPIVHAFEACGREVAGHFVWGNTGVFHDARRAIPVIEGAPLLRLKDALLSSA